MNSSSAASIQRNDPEPLRKRKRMKTSPIHQNDLAINKTRWRTESEQTIYSSKLVQALRHVRRTNSSSSSSYTVLEKSRGSDVREAADRVLAVSAKGRTRWSRAILRRSRLKLRHKKVKKQKLSLSGGSFRRDCERDSLKRSVPAVQRKLRVLGRLVPGCRKLHASNLLEEATDYIAALEMQVRAMSAVAELLSGSAGGALASQLASS